MEICHSYYEDGKSEWYWIVYLPVISSLKAKIILVTMKMWQLYISWQIWDDRMTSLVDNRAELKISSQVVIMVLMQGVIVHSFGKRPD